MKTSTAEQSESIATERVACPVCEGSESTPWGSENGWSAGRCVQCGCVFVNPRPVAPDISQAAKTGLHPTQSGLRNMIESYRRSTVNDYRARFSEIFTKDEVSRPNLRWLDVGAGFGQLVTAVQHMLPADAVVEGLEPSEHKRLVASKHGLNLHEGTLEEFAGGTYDVVSMSNVLSHLADPRRSIAQLRALLRPGGHLILLTGNLADCKVEDCPGALNFPDHLLFVGKKTLNRLLTDGGFEIEIIKEYKSFFPENELVRMIKNVVKRLLGRPIRTKNTGPFRDLLVKARRA